MERAEQLALHSNEVFVSATYELMQIDRKGTLVYNTYNDLQAKIIEVVETAKLPDATKEQKTTAIVCVAAASFLDRVLRFNEMSKEVSGS